METPRRTSQLAPMSSKVGQSNVRQRLFSPDSGIGNSPATGIPQTGKEISTDYRSNRRSAGSSPITRQSRVRCRRGNLVNDNVQNKGNGWKKFWLIWAVILVASTSLIAIAWAYFPNNKVVQKSQEYVMTGLITVVLILVSTGLLKVLFHCFSKKSLETDIQIWPENNDDPGYSLEVDPGNSSEEYENSEIENNSFELVNNPSENTAPGNDRSTLVGPRVKFATNGFETDLSETKFRNDTVPDYHNRAEVSNTKSDVISRTNVFPIPGDNISNGFSQNSVGSQPNYGLDASPTKAFGYSSAEFQVRRTFSGNNNDVWNEYIRYFENISELNNWNREKARRVLLSTFRGQAETYAYGMPLVIQRDFDRLKQKMDERFGHTAMKEKYVTEAKLRKRQSNESLRDFGQAIEDLFRRAYPNNPEIVEENSIKYFLDKCGQSEDFRLAVKRMRPKTLQEAVFFAMQEECLRAGEKDLVKDARPYQKQIYEVEDHFKNKEVASSSEVVKPKYIEYREKDESRYDNIGGYSRGGIRYQRRPYPRYGVRGRGGPVNVQNQSFRTQGDVRRDSESFRAKDGDRRDSDKPLN